MLVRRNTRQSYVTDLKVTDSDCAFNVPTTPRRQTKKVFVRIRKNACTKKRRIFFGKQLCFFRSWRRFKRQQSRTRRAQNLLSAYQNQIWTGRHVIRPLRLCYMVQVASSPVASPRHSRQPTFSLQVAK